MGNLLEIDLSKYGCTCFNQEDKNFLDFFEDIKEKSNPSLNTIISQENKTKNETTTLATTNKKYEKITYVPKNKENSVLNNKNYLKEFDFSYTEMNVTNNNFNEKINESKTKTKNEEDEDIDEFNSNTDYYQLAHQIAESIKELKNNFNISDMKNNFETVLKNIGKTADIICFNDVIGCIKKISDINSEINLIGEKIFLGLVNKFNKKNNSTHFINFSDEEKIVEIPNFNGISDDIKKKFGKYNNPKFKFTKFNLKGSFPNEILIWKVISKNIDKIKKIINDNYYCCAVLLYQGKNNTDNNETIIYFINKI
jgi:hypothetical protein